MRKALRGTTLIISSRQNRENSKHIKQYDEFEIANDLTFFDNFEVHTSFKIKNG